MTEDESVFEIVENRVYVHGEVLSDKMEKKSVYRWTAIIFLPLFTVAIFSAICFNTDYTNSSGDIFTTLASVQAAIFAIVFSVIILGVQLSASQYSPRLINVFRNDPAYLFTSLLFITSIGFDVFGLYVDSLSQFELQMFVHTAGVIAITSLSVLYIFVDGTLYNSTPEGILNRVKKRMTPERVAEQATRAHNDVSEPDPFLNALGVVRSALQENDSPTVSFGLNIIAERTEAFLRSPHNPDDRVNLPIADSIEQLCTNRLPPLVESAVEREQVDEAQTVINCFETIAEAGTDTETGYVVGYAVEGLADSIANLGYGNSAEGVRKELSDTSYKCLKTASEVQLWNGTARGILLLTWRAAQSILAREAPDERGRVYDNLLLLGVSEVNNNVIDEVEDQIDDGDVNWLHAEHNSDLSDLNPDEQVLHACYVGMCEVTSAVIRNELITERRLVRWSSLGAGWRKCVKKTESSSLESLHEQWLGTALYLEYLQTETPDTTLSDFSAISRQIDPPQTIQVIEKILDGDLDARAQIDHMPGYGHPIELPPLTGYRSAPLTDPDESFEEWLNWKKTSLDQTGNLFT